MTNHPVAADRVGGWYFVRRFAIYALIAFAAYFFTLLFIFPRYIAPLAAFHADLYSPADAVATGVGFHAAVHYARPVGVFIGLLAGRAGFEASMAVEIVIAVLMLALSMTLFDAFFLRRTIPWWIAFVTFVLAMSAPAFYFTAGYDPGDPAALLGMLGVFAWESRRKATPAFVLASVLFSLSGLVKESFLPALAVYAVAVAFRDARRDGFSAFAIIAAPFLAVAVALADGAAVNSAFLHAATGQANPYDVSINPVSILTSFKFYTSPLINAPFAALLGSCLFGIWLHDRLRIGVVVVLAALALYAPYLILPNHLLGYYFWVPWPILMLLIPLAWCPGAVASSRATALAAVRQNTWWLRLGSAALAVSLVFTLLHLRAPDAFENWSLEQQNINRSLLSGIRSLRPQLQTSRSVLLVGLAWPFHPWLYPAFLNRDLGYHGRWTAAVDPRGYSPPAQLAAVPYASLHWSDYDLVVVFRGDGGLLGAYLPEKLAAQQTAARNISNSELVQSLEAGQIFIPSAAGASPAPEATPANRLVYPAGVVDSIVGQGAMHGIWGAPVAEASSCCWVGPEVAFLVSASRGSRTIRLTVYQPPIASVAQQTLSLLDDRGSVVASHHVSEGVKSYRFPLRFGSSAGPVMVKLRFSQSVVPKDSGSGTDSRRLSAIIQNVATQ